MDDRDELLALAAGLEGIDGARLASDFAGATSVHALRTDTALARGPDRVALVLGQTAQPPGEPGPRFSTPSYTFEAHGRTATGAWIPAARDVRADAPQRRAGARTAPRRRARRISARRAGEPDATGEVAAATGRPVNDTRAALHELATRRVVRRIAIGNEDELWRFGPPAVEPRCRWSPARPEPIATTRRLTPKHRRSQERVAIARSSADRANAGRLRWRAVDRGRVGFGGRAGPDATLERPIPPCRGLPHLHAGWRAPR
jgi:hypothetical protein